MILLALRAFDLEEDHVTQQVVKAFLYTPVFFVVLEPGKVKLHLALGGEFGF